MNPRQKSIEVVRTVLRSFEKITSSFLLKLLISLVSQIVRAITVTVSAAKIERRIWNYYAPILEIMMISTVSTNPKVVQNTIKPLKISLIDLEWQRYPGAFVLNLYSFISLSMTISRHKLLQCTIPINMSNTSDASPNLKTQGSKKK